MKGVELVKRFHGNWPTNKGGWIPGGNVYFREKSLFDDFFGKPWMSLIIYGVRGVLPSEQEIRMVEHFAGLCCSYPDPRLWNNRIAAMCGSTRSTGVLGIAAATAISEAKIFGRRADINGAHFLQKTKAFVADGGDLDSYLRTYLREHRAIPGFGRPIIAKDERIAPLIKEAARQGFGDGDYLNLVERIAESLTRQRLRMKPNISIYCAAVTLDMGWSQQEFYLVAIITFTAGMLPCYVDATEKSEGVFFPLECKQIDYRGEEKRKLENANT